MFSKGKYKEANLLGWLRNREVQMDDWLLRAAASYQPLASRCSLACSLSQGAGGGVLQLGAMKASDTQREDVWNSSPRAPRKYFSAHEVLSNSLCHTHYFDLKCSLLLSCLPCLFSVFLPQFLLFCTHISFSPMTSF